MKKMKFTVGAEAADVDPNTEGFYDGPTPPKGVYRFQLKFLNMKENSNGDPMLNGVLEIAERPKSEKGKFNGYGMWFNLNVTKQGAPYVNNFLDVFGFNRKAFWGTGGVTVDENDDPATVTKIGSKTVNPEKMQCKIRTKFKTYQGEKELAVAGAGFMPLSASGDEEDADWDEDESDDSEEVVDEEVVDGEEDESDEDEDSDEDESDEEEEEGDDEEEEGDEWTLEALKEQYRDYLKVMVKDYDADFKILKRHTADDLAEAIWELMAAEDEDGADEEDEEEEAEEAPPARKGKRGKRAPF